MQQPTFGDRSVLQRRNSVSNTIQAVLDGLAVVGIAYWLIDVHIGLLTQEYVIQLLLLMGTLAMAYDSYAIYRSNSNMTSSAVRLWKAWSVAFGFLIALAFLSDQTEQYSRPLALQLYILGYLAQLLLHIGMREIQKTLLKHTHEPENVIFIGSGLLANFLYLKIANNPWLGQRVVGCIPLHESPVEPAASPSGTGGFARRSTDLPATGFTSPSSGGGGTDSVPGGNSPVVLGQLSALGSILDQHAVRTVYFVTPLHDSKVLEELYFSLLDRHIAVHWVPDIFSLRLVNHSVREIAGIPVLTLSETPLTGTSLMLKAIEDRVLSLLILILISPILLTVAIAIKLDSPGPVFFRQKRMGWNGKIFSIWKFRSMIVHQAEGGTLKQAEKGDPRVTRVGAFIRRTSLDELPQIFNVLRGEMSLVGPRPHAIQHDEEYSRRITDYFARHNIKPGITGLAQVRGFRGETKNIEQMIQRVESDIEYINNWSLWLDLTILVRTTSAFTGKTAY